MKLTLSDEIRNADQQAAIVKFQGQIKNIPENQLRELLGCLLITGDQELAKILFGIESLDIITKRVPIYVPEVQPIYQGNHRDTPYLILDTLSIKELEILLQAFFKNKDDRDYIISRVFHKNAFLSKPSSNVLDYLSQSSKLFNQVGTPQKKNFLRLVTLESNNSITSDNDSNYTPLVDRIENMEPGYFTYIHEMYLGRLAYVESIFCEVISSLAEEPKNHIWALDPTSLPLHISPYLQDKITLITAICEFHTIIDPHFPRLHTLIESTLASWILLYKGFSAPVEKVRRILGCSIQ